MKVQVVLLCYIAGSLCFLFFALGRAYETRQWGKWLVSKSRESDDAR